jgi:tetratricopeptide (TPR) repeat protein
MAKWQKYKEDFILLLEAGFIAVNQADEDAALKLLRAAELLDPENTLPIVGFGYLHLHKLELKQACERFEHVLKKDPHNDMAKTLLGLALSMQPNAVTKGEKMLEQTVKSKDPMIKELSHTALDFVERFIKKPGGPAATEKRK